MKSVVKSVGNIKLIVDHLDGKREEFFYKNSLLKNGRIALVSSLANQYGDNYDYFISKMLFGDGGTSGGVPKSVNSERTGLFGTTRASKPIIATIDPVVTTKLSILSVLSYDDANGFALNEMALQMDNGELYSMATFPDFTKTSAQQLTWIWELNFI